MLTLRAIKLCYLQFSGLPVFQRCSFHYCRALQCQQNTSLPDYNTSINVHEHRLKRPEMPAARLKVSPPKQATSLIPDTLKEMETNEDFQVNLRNLKKLGQKQLTKEERLKRQRALSNLGVPHFREFVKKYSGNSEELQNESLSKYLRKTSIDLFQMNIGLYCNQACNHCHVESSPKRTEMMDRAIADRCLDIIRNSPSIHTLDITGGAPELCSEFRHLVSHGRKLGLTVIDRCNLTVLLEPGQENTAEFLADNGVVVIASLPCYSAKNVNLQRGSKVFQRSVQALEILNSCGYGKPGTDLQLHLVYNPLGGFLPPPQTDLEQKYKEELWDNFGVEFNNLFTLTNMPIKRFADFLYRRNELETYMNLLVRNFNPASLSGLMCRNYISVNWQGALYDCDFNQQLDMPMKKPKTGGSLSSKSAPTVWDINSTDDLFDLRIMTDNHCFGCTAGMGSSCQGTTA